MNEVEFRKTVAQNLILYRKRQGMTQADAAERIHYSDKSVSKWERGDGLPDAYVLRQLAELYGCTMNDLTRDAGEAPELPAEPPAEETPAPSEKLPCRSPFTVCLAIGGVWLVATLVFSILCMLETDVKAPYMAFLYAIPATFAVLELFTAIWKLPAILHLLFCSGILWTLTMCVHLNMRTLSNVFLLYVVAAVAQLLGIFAMGLYWDMIHVPKGRLDRLTHRLSHREKSK